MGRLHSHNYGKSHSIRPLNPKVPSWVKQDQKEIEELILKYAKEDLTSSQIGVKLRDQHSIPLVKPIIKKTISQVLEENDLKADLPLTNMAVAIPPNIAPAIIEDPKTPLASR